MCSSYLNTPSNTQLNTQSLGGNIIGVCGALYGDNIIHVFRCKDNSIKEGFYFEETLFDIFNIDCQKGELNKSRELDKKLRENTNRFEFLHRCRHRRKSKSHRLFRQTSRI